MNFLKDYTVLKRGFDIFLPFFGLFFSFLSLIFAFAIEKPRYLWRYEIVEFHSFYPYSWVR